MQRACLDLLSGLESGGMGQLQNRLYIPLGWTPTLRQTALATPAARTQSKERFEVDFALLRTPCQGVNGNFTDAV